MKRVWSLLLALAVLVGAGIPARAAQEAANPPTPRPPVGGGIDRPWGSPWTIA